VPFGSEGLIIAWTGPVPAKSRIALVEREVFQPVNRALDLHDYERGGLEHNQPVYLSQVFNVGLAWTREETVQWNSRFGMHLSKQAQDLFEKYLRSDEFVIFESLVEHPPVLHPEMFAACNVMFQRGDIYYANGREDLYLWSRFQTSSGMGPGAAPATRTAIDFAPASALHVSFPTDTIWYPLEVTKLNTGPTDVMLNVLTEKELTGKAAVKGFRLEKGGRLDLGARSYYVSHLRARFDGGKEVSDVRLKA